MSPRNDLNDPFVYRITVGMIGVALIVLLAGLCVLAALEKDISQSFWTTASALGGGLLGILAPPPAPSSVGEVESKVEASDSHHVKFGKELWRLAKIVVKDLWENRAVVVLLIVFGVSVVVGVADDIGRLQSLAAASGAALVGLLGPAPGAAKDAAGSK